TVIRSCGSRALEFWVLERAANISVSPPTRPKNIRPIKIRRETVCSCGVSPKDRPTVPMAEAVSNRLSRIGCPSIRLITSPPARNSPRYIAKIVAAWEMVSLEIRRLKKCGYSLRRKTASAFARRTASVVVFMPPAVEPGEPPMSISMVIIVCPLSLIAVKSAVLKPAVRGVT
ncbi:RNA polymerase sigma factor sigV, partial [Dysosmobacter welbionis]